VHQLADSSLLQEAAFIGNRWVTGSTWISVRNPASGEEVGRVPALGTAETNQAIDAAVTAFPAWRGVGAGRRAELLEAWHDAMIDSLDDLARIMTLEQGKPLAESRGEIRYGASFVKWFSEEARRVYGDTIPAPTPDRRILALREPVGVCAAITPWNFPNAMIARKVGPALAAGCTIVVKPSELTPFSALAMAALAERVGIPPGVLNIVTGHPEAIGDALTSSAVVRKLSFTGSTRVGKLLMEKCAPTLKRVSLELGGNAPFIVFSDADLDTAIKGVVASKFRNAGQTCVSANRILVQDEIYDEFARRLTDAVARQVVGDGLEDGVTIGPLINGAAVDKVIGHIDDARTRGAGATKGGGAPGRGGPLLPPPGRTSMRRSARSHRCSGFAPRTRRWRSPTVRRSALPRTSTRRTSTAPGASPSGSNAGWLA
jgi:succinate-semialdehyde dehydrogenase / glutarate-semialdehyde dehydrogenase